VLVTSQHSPIRPLDTRHDLLAVANLIDLCFSDQMDQDGRDYVRHIRRVAEDRSLLHWIQGASERVSVPLHGYVWVEEGRIVGNLSLVPFWKGKGWVYLIANVAVHPDFRKQGIGHKITQVALEHVRSHGAQAAWLQVRDDNPVAYHLYRSLGFVERARRTIWQTTEELPNDVIPMPAGIKVSRRVSSDWSQQQRWLKENYPPQVTWNLPFNKDSFKPGLINDFIRWINSVEIIHYSARSRDKLLGVVSWEPSGQSSDTLWLATCPEYEENAVQALLPYIWQNNPRYRTLALNYPAGRSVDAFYATGFSPRNTLIWMEVKMS